MVNQMQPSGINSGLVLVEHNSIDRVVEALNSIHSDWIHWPDANERVEIAKRIEKEFFFPNCISLMDGTRLPLAIQPCSSEDYIGRKFQYFLLKVTGNS